MKKSTLSHGIIGAVSVILVLNVALAANFHLSGAAAPILQQQRAYGQDFLIGSADAPVLNSTELQERNEQRQAQERQEYLRQKELQQQQQPQTTTGTASAATQQYTDAENGIRVKIPAGWIGVNLVESSVFGDLSEEETLDVLNAGRMPYQTMTHLCPENTTNLVVGSGSECPITPDPIKIGVAKYNFETDAMIQFADVIESGRDITTNDLWAYEMQLQRIDSSELTVTNETDRTTNLIDSETGEVIANNVPVKIVEFTSKAAGAQPNWPYDRTDLKMFVVYNDPESDEVAAYNVVVGTVDQENRVATAPGTLIQQPAVQQVFNSFELVS